MSTGLVSPTPVHHSQVPYRFSPIGSGGELVEAIEYVADLAGVLAESLTGRRPSVRYLTLFAHYQAEYIALCQMVSKMGRSILANNGTAARLHHPIDVAGQHITSLRIRRPDPYRMQVGCCDLDVPDYAAFKDQHYYEGSPTIRKVDHREFEMLELFAPGFDVLAYVVGPYHQARQRFYRPLLHSVDSRPVVIYPAKDTNNLDSHLPRTTGGTVEQYVTSTLKANEAQLAAADYVIAIPWSDGPRLYLDAWYFQMANISDSDPLINAVTYAGDTQVTDLGTTSGDAMILLGYEEQLRHAARSLTEYLADADRSDELPHTCRADEDYYTLQAIRTIPATP